MYSLFKKYIHAVLEFIDKWYVLHNIHHVHGSRPSAGAAEEFTVVSLVKDAECFLDEFVLYYQKLGARHIYLIDNGSSDNTVRLSIKYDNVTIYSTSLDFNTYESRIRRYFIKQFFSLSWVLCVDADEHFDFPCSSKITMSGFINYLNEHNYTAVVACMLDMFPREEYEKLPDEPFSAVYKYVDISEIKKEVYPTDWYCSRGNKVPDRVVSYSGGVRKRITDASNNYLLIKHPLIYVKNDVVPFTHPHYSANVSVADVTCALLHYKFVNGFEDRLKQVANDIRSHPAWALENRACINFMASNNVFFSENAIEYQSVEDLSDKGLLFISTRYYHWFCKK